MSTKERLMAGARSHGLWFVVVGTLLVLAVLVRSKGFFDDTNGLWWDEASWVRKISRGNYGIRPIGYSLLSRKLIEHAPTEVMVRLPSFVASLLTLPAFLWLARQLPLGRAATFAGLFILSVHPWAVNYAKEFKPYAFDLLLVFVVLGAVVHFVRRPSRLGLFGLGAVVAAAPLFSWAVACLYPGAWLLTVRSQMARRAKGELWTLGVLTFLALASAFAIYSVRLRGRNLSSGYWGAKYGVFFEGEGLVERLEWLGDETFGVLTFPGRLMPTFEVEWLHAAAPLAWAALALVGLTRLLVTRSGERLVVWVLPWLLVVFANQVGLWPYGVFRTNLFLLVFPLGLGLEGIEAIICAFERWAKRSSAPRRAQVVRGLLTAVGALSAFAFTPLSLEPFRVKDRSTGVESTSLPAALRLLQPVAANSRNKVRLLMDAHACASFAYYDRVHPTTKVAYRPTFKKLRALCLTNDSRKLDRDFKRRRGRGAVWVLASGTKGQKELRAIAEKRCAVGQLHEFETGDFLLSCAPREPKPRVTEGE